MKLATGGAWTGSYTNHIIDGVDVWNSILNNTKSSRDEMVFISKPDNYDSAYVAQYNGVKYFYNVNASDPSKPEIYFMDDLNAELSHMSCSNPSLTDFETNSNSNILMLVGISQRIFNNASSYISKYVMILVLIAIFVMLSIVSNKFYEPTSTLIEKEPLLSANTNLDGRLNEITV